MSNSMEETARAFFEACETGQGWQACAQYCKPGGSFSVQSEVLMDVTTLEAYTEWMKAILGPLPDGSYELKSWAVDEERSNVSAYAVFTGTHTGEGGPCPPTGKSTTLDYVYVMFFDGDKIGHMTKIWHSGITMQQLGWA